jgi:hypothetical protein
LEASCSGGCLVDKFGLVLGAEFSSELVIVLLAIPVSHEVDSKSFVVLEAHDEEVSASDGVVNGESSLVAEGISVGRQLSAFEENGADLRVGGNGSLGLTNNAGCAVSYVNLLTFDNGFKTVNIFAAKNFEAFTLGVDTTLISDEVVHGGESGGIGSHNKDDLLRGVGACDGGELSEGRHEHGLGGVLSGETLIKHHESAVTSNATDTLGNKFINCLEELSLDSRGQLT